MSDFEKPGKCPVCESDDTCDEECLYQDSSVLCNGCGFFVGLRHGTSAERISIWNRLSLSPESPVAPVPPAVGVETDSGAWSGEEGKLSHGWGWHIYATDMDDKTCPECGDEDGLKIEAGIGPYSLCATKCLACGYESSAASVYPDSDGAEKEALEGWGDQGSGEEGQS